MTDPTPDVPTPVGRPQGGMKSEDGRSAYWRMQWESAIGALADLIAEHTETVDRLEAAEGAVVAIRRYAEAHAVTAKAQGRDDRDWLDLLHILDLRAALAEVTP